MDNAIYVGLSKQIVLQRALDIAANNLANTDTAGFKFEDLLTNPDPAPPAMTAGIPTPVTFVADGGVARDFSQGPLSQTGGAFDVAIDGKGFFQVSTAAGPRYTRDGRFKLDPTGKLVTQEGDPVQGDGGDIVIDPALGPISIAANGVVSQAGQRIGKLALVTFDNLSALSKEGNNLYSNPSNLPAQPSTTATLKQGMLEGANVQPIVQVTRLIQISRAYETITNLVNTANDLSKAAVQRLGAAS
ncbi:MAG: flagellar basal-body rod protein FlgF [Caulobacteraceae bacterium]|nr:flagellar basal-body rod protein FlgF [Caulobacteraceae bacterium]